MQPVPITPEQRAFLTSHLDSTLHAAIENNGGWSDADGGWYVYYGNGVVVILKEDKPNETRLEIIRQ